ncbi:MAG: 16S rRNA (adenine(1518)-N(6)/adenine(1519)-N(6))-dimethyltransferase RsmA [Candidatus Eisenbacteria bacterium]
MSDERPGDLASESTGDDRSERQRLEAHGIRPRKRFGQNFLVDPRIPELTVARASWQPGDLVLEIGPGSGALTSALLSAGHPVRAIEMDRDLVPVLLERFRAERAAGRFGVREGDALELDWTEDLPEGSRPWIAGNLPYSITTPLLLRAFAHRDRFAGAVFMLQREYGDRLLAAPGNKTYSSITVFTKAHAEVRSVLKVGRSSFWPRPGVESMVVELAFPEVAPFPGDRTALERVVRAAFGQRRKTLVNSLTSGLSREKAWVAGVLEGAGIDPEVRAETLGLPEFARITETALALGL